VHCDYFAHNTSSEEKRLIVNSPDTDVAVLCCHHFCALGVTELWFHTGTGKRTRFIPVHEIVETIGEEICELLPAFHVLTGCDSTSSLHGIGKKKALSILRTNMDVLQDTKEIGNDDSEISDKTLEVAMRFIALLYGRDSPDLNNLRYKLFTKKNCESSRLPPTIDSAQEHIKRANYQCFIWKHARDRNLSVTSPVGNGWIKDDMGILIPKLMNKAPAPESLIELVACGCQKGCRVKCSCRSVQLPCTEACKCDSECSNVHMTMEGDEEED
jgi:hypothetical protein